MSRAAASHVCSELLRILATIGDIYEMDMTYSKEPLTVARVMRVSRGNANPALVRSIVEMLNLVETTGGIGGLPNPIDHPR